MKYNGIEAQGTGKHSHISSGIGASCDWYQGGNSNNYLVITCTTDTLVQYVLPHRTRLGTPLTLSRYYVGRYNDPAIHMYT